MRPLIIQGGKCKRDKKYRKGWLEYYDLGEFLKNIPSEKSVKSGKKAKKIDIEESSSSSESD
jgi:hypothetical protein